MSACLAEDAAAIEGSDTVDAGGVYITELPDTIDDWSVAGYRAVDLPLRSELRAFSFFWKTTDADRGTRSLQFFATPADSALSVPLDSLDRLLTIDVSVP